VRIESTAVAALYLTVQHRVVQKRAARLTTWLWAALLLRHEAAAALSGHMLETELTIFVLIH
jgi:hypothetical protein